MKPDIKTRIAKGEFSSKLPYGDTPESRKAWRVDTYHLEEDVFRAALLVELGIEDHPKAGRLWRMAWEKQHHGGLYAVFDEAEYLSQLLLGED
jgi:hypothetical protein